MQQLNLDIMEYVENHILPRYADFGKSHGLSHVMRVIKNSMELARFTGADIDMAYVVAAYHDLGMNGPRAIHHLTGGKILASDARLKKWFSPERIVIMKEAVEDHLAPFMVRLSPKPTATLIPRWSSGGQYSLDLRNIPISPQSNNGSVLSCI